MKRRSILSLAWELHDKEERRLKRIKKADAPAPVEPAAKKAAKKGKR